MSGIPLAQGTPGTPGSQVLEELKKRKLQLAAFKVPTNVAGKKKQTILTEEKYVEEMSKIIQRDFFPDLEKLQAQNEYLDAVGKKNYSKMESIRLKYSGRRMTELNTILMSPATFETPLNTTTEPTLENISSTDMDETPKSNISKINTEKSIFENYSLDSFLNKYTSEDNYSFEEIIDKADEKLRQKFSVLYHEEQLSAEKLARALTLPSIENQFMENDPLRKIETWAYTNRNSIMFTPDGVALTEREQIEAVNRKQAIQHDATRLKTNPFASLDNNSDGENSKNHPKLLSDKVGVDGNVITQRDKELPEIRGFQLVKTPSPRPGEAFSPFMTWGEIEGTPFRLDGSDTPVRPSSGPCFKINENSRRENIAIALAEKVGEKIRAEKQRARDTAHRNMNSPFIRSSIDRLASMSPAARRLATGKWGLKSPMLNTPSPYHFSNKFSKGKLTSNKPNTNNNTSSIKTPNRTPSSVSSSASLQQMNSGKSSLTDNLLMIPKKRLTATDFF